MFCNRDGWVRKCFGQTARACAGVMPPGSVVVVSAMCSCCVGSLCEAENSAHSSELGCADFGIMQPVSNQMRPPLIISWISLCRSRSPCSTAPSALTHIRVLSTTRTSLTVYYTYYENSLTSVYLIKHPKR